MALLRSPQYYNRHIRLAGLQLANGSGCSTLGPALPQLADAGIPVSPDFHISSTAPMFDTERETLVYARRNGNLAYWVLDSSWSHELLRTPCNDCFYLEFNHKHPTQSGLFFGSSRDLGEVEVDRQGAGKLAVSKHTTTITLLSPCIILILPPSGQVIPSSPKRFLPTITPCLPLSLAPTSCPVVADACNPRH